MEEKRQVKVSLLTVILLFILIVIIVALGVFQYLGYEKITKLEEEKNGLKEEVHILQNQVSLSQTQKTQDNFVPNGNATKIVKKEELIEELFLKQLKEWDDSNEEKLLDYRVDAVIILSENEKNEIISNSTTYKNEDILATVTYSVKPKDINRTVWIAGNGDIQGEWLIEKEACVGLRNEELIGGGTGW